MRQGQSLVITPQLQQAIKLLQLSNMELEAYVEGEIERNPLLQRDEADGAPEERRGERDDAPESPAHGEMELGDGGDRSEALDCGKEDIYDAAPGERSSGD